jgi:hypothetical protein
MLTSSVSGVQEVFNFFHTPFDPTLWHGLIGTGMCEYCAKSFAFRLKDANDTAVIYDLPYGMYDNKEKKLIFILDMDNKNTQINVNNYVSKY